MKMKFGIWNVRFAICAALCAALAGCGTTQADRDARLEAFGDVLDVALATYGEWQESQNQVEAPPPVPIIEPVPTPEIPLVTNAPVLHAGAGDFNGLKFRNSRDCRAWPVTITISDVTVRGGNIFWTEARGQREARGWNVKTGRKSINAECVLLIPSMASAGMFDYATTTQRDKILANLKVSHEGPGFFPGWVPKKGERVGFCIATISRDPSAAKMQERSNVVWFIWPRDGV